MRKLHYHYTFSKSLVQLLLTLKFIPSRSWTPTIFSQHQVPGSIVRTTPSLPLGLLVLSFLPYMFLVYALSILPYSQFITLFEKTSTLRLWIEIIFLTTLSLHFPIEYNLKKKRKQILTCLTLYSIVMLNECELNFSHRGKGNQIEFLRSQDLILCCLLRWPLSI